MSLIDASSISGMSVSATPSVVLEPANDLVIERLPYKKKYRAGEKVDFSGLIVSWGGRHHKPNAVKRKTR